MSANLRARSGPRAMEESRPAHHLLGLCIYHHLSAFHGQPENVLRLALGSMIRDDTRHLSKSTHCATTTLVLLRPNSSIIGMLETLIILDQRRRSSFRVRNTRPPGGVFGVFEAKGRINRSSECIASTDQMQSRTRRRHNLRTTL